MNEARRQQGRLGHVMSGLTVEQRALVSAEFVRIAARENPSHRSGYHYEGWSLTRTPTTGIPRQVSLLKRSANGSVTQVIHICHD